MTWLKCSPICPFVQQEQDPWRKSAMMGRQKGCVGEWGLIPADFLQNSIVSHFLLFIHPLNHLSIRRPNHLQVYPTICIHPNTHYITSTCQSTDFQILWMSVVSLSHRQAVCFRGKVWYPNLSLRHFQKIKVMRMKNVKANKSVITTALGWAASLRCARVARMGLHKCSCHQIFPATGQWLYK